MPSSRRTLSIAALVSGCALAAGLCGVRLGRIYERNWQCCRVPNPRRIALSLEETAGISAYTSDRGQDKWVAETVFPGITDGYFLDVGSADGVQLSNSYALERRGWKGICVDPFPRNMATRTCHVSRSVVDSEAGRHVTFLQAGDMGGIGTYLNATRSVVQKAPPVELVTTTLAQILADAKAPPFIQFMSLDIEGAELAALQGFPFDTHSLGSVVVEHNFEEAKRAAIETLLAGHGLVRVHSWYADDFYVAAGSTRRQ
jgi:Methyltransferase FkbM domain